MPQSRAMFEATERVNMLTYGRTRVQAWEQGICIRCMGPVAPLDFRTPMSMAEYTQSALCQSCQDLPDLFGSEDRWPAGDGEPTITDRGMALHLQQRRYATGALRVELVTDTHEPYTTITTNVPEVELPPFVLVMQIHNGQEDVVRLLEDLGIIRFLPWAIPSGHLMLPIAVFLRPIVAPEVPAGESAAAVDRLRRMEAP